MNIVGSRWVLKTKLKLVGSVEHFKACFVAKGYNQLIVIDVHDISSVASKLGCAYVYFTFSIHYKLQHYGSKILLWASKR
uniref:Uncharacterized protein n=1 Tax=Solanum lycopersicum TaxID=4081 RepID=A0A3Q7GIZ1_SOLLC